MGLQILEITEQKSTRKTKFLAELTASTNLFGISHEEHASVFPTNSFFPVNSNLPTCRAG